MIKIRSYIIVKNHAAAIALVEKLRPLLEAGKRWMDLCELDLLNAIALFRADKKEVAFKALSRSLKIVHRRKYIRLVADEGEAILPLINAFIKEKGLDSFGKDFFEKIITPARALAVNYPLYLKPVKNETILSDTETEILRFLERGKTADEIAEYFLISRNTVKYHLKNLYTKLDVTNATGAVWEAKVQGIL
jgi:LuxR family maltose regulon positive regulatory protein